MSLAHGSGNKCATRWLTRRHRKWARRSATCSPRLADDDCMAESRTCSACGALIPQGAPAGQCIRCLLGFADEDAERAGQAPEPPVFGDFKFLDDGKEGGMGVVYRARQISLKRIVALKMIRSGSFASAQ